MPRSPQTRLLTANAHALGDEYYRSLSVATRAGELDPACLDLAFAYKKALEELRAHLSTLENQPEVTLLTEATERYIALIHKDFEVYQIKDPLDGK